MVIGEDGYPTTEMEQDDGSVVTGDFDLVPILETFIKEHPGFSYKGARALSHLRATMEFLDTGQMNLIRTPIPITRRTANRRPQSHSA